MEIHIPFTFHHMLFSASPYFQRNNRKYHTKNRYNPESGYDFTFIVSKFLVMMMQWAHEKNPPAFTKLSPGIFKITHLQHHTDIFYQKYSTEYRDQQFLAYDYC